MKYIAELTGIFGKGRNFPRKKVLVLEGGGMRGIFLVGILQAFAERGYFPWKLVIGTSAGAFSAALYLSRQIYLARDAFFTALLSKKFIQYSNIFKQDRHVINLDWMIDSIIKEAREKLNIKKLRKSCPLLIAATEVIQNSPPQSIFFNSKTDNPLEALKATAAIPYFYKGFVRYHGKLFLDGGILTPIPYQKALSLGYKERDILILLTRPRGYRKRRMSFWMKKIYEQYYKDPKHDQLLEALMLSHEKYNLILDKLENDHPGIDIIYPPNDFEVKRLTRDEKKILAGFEQGIFEAVTFLHKTA